MIWEVPGVRVGHWTDPEARTGCTVVLFDPPVVASGEVRGGAPATREFALLDPLALVDRIDAVVLSGGSAFGLSAVDGVVGWCEGEARGWPTSACPVPIVVGMALYDLGVGSSEVRPGPDQGRAACEASPSEELGAVGAGCGAMVGKWRGPEAALPGGLAGAVERQGDLAVAVLVAVNAWGDVAGYGHHGEPPPDLTRPADPGAFGAAANTTIGVVVTNARLDAAGCQHLARGAHDGLARSVDPPHATVDGDAFVAAATGQVEAPIDLVRWLGVRAVDRAVRSIGARR